MTNEIAFELGLGKFNVFYDCPVWKPNIQEFEYVNFFNWSSPTRSRQESESIFTWGFYGSLKEEKFCLLEHKRQYILGALNSYAGKTQKDQISFCFANSFSTRDRIAKWAGEILKEEFGGFKTWSITKEDEMFYCPAIAKVNIKCEDIELFFKKNT